jgi:hypothetical protein
MTRSLVTLGLCLLLAGVGCDRQETPAETQQDVSEARQERDQQVADARREAAEETADARRASATC